MLLNIQQQFRLRIKIIIFVVHCWTEKSVLFACFEEKSIGITYEFNLIIVKCSQVLKM